MKYNFKAPFIFVLTIFFNCSIYSQWQQQTSPTTARLEALFFIDANVGFTSGVFLQMYKTINGGQNWTSIGNYSSREIHFFDGVNGYASAAAGAANGTMQKITNSGGTWSEITAPNSAAYLGVFATSATTAFFINTENKVIKSTNSGAILSSYTIPLSITPGASLTDIFFVSSTTGFVTSNQGEIFKTTNAGATWNLLTTNFVVSIRSIYFVNSLTGYAACGGGKILKTIDGGATWSLKLTGATNAINYIRFYDANNGLVVCLSGKIFRTNDAGETWIQQDSGTTNHLYSVFYLSATSAIIVGEGGTILKNLNLLSTNEFDKKNVFAIFPNPSKNSINIKSDFDLKINSIEIYDILGKLVLEISNPIETKTIDVTCLSSGTYFAKIYSDNGINNSKFLKE